MELTDIIDLYEERAAILQFDAGYGKGDAERIAWLETLKEATKRGVDKELIAAAKRRIK